MKQGLSLRVSQHLTLTPQLQQSIRLLQLSTLELSQEIEQMLDENPFLEEDPDAIEREEFGLSHVNAPAAQEEADDEAEPAISEPSDSDWEGDGSVEISPDDSEWGGDAPASAAKSEDERTEASEWASSQASLAEHLHRQALTLRLDEVDRAALAYLIDNLNEDGYPELIRSYRIQNTILEEEEVEGEGETQGGR